MGWKIHLLLKPILAGILFGLFITILIFPIYKSAESLLLSLRIGLIFGLILLFANLIHLRMMRRKQSQSLKSHHMQEVELPIPYDRAFDLCVNAVKSLKNCKIQELSSEKIVAVKPTKVPLDWIYNRDIITIELLRVDDNRTNVKISSRLFPDPPSKYYADYGSNLENIEKISEFLLKNVSKLPSAR